VRPGFAAVVIASMASLICLGAPPRARAASPHVNYMLHCQGCHLADGTATPGIIPPLVGAAKFLSAEGGREYLVRVPGVALSTIPDAELAALVNWFLGQFSPDQVPDDFVPYTAEEVSEYRQQPLVDVDSVRKAIIGKAYYE
jgi:mono/diheme cytochrome c family protein